MAIEEVLKFVHTSKEDLLEATQFTEELVRTLDRVCQLRRCALLRLGHNGNVFSHDGDGNISRDEFSKVVGEQPILYVSAATPAQPRWRGGVLSPANPIFFHYKTLLQGEFQ